jgi:hypothetical protein
MDLELSNLLEDRIQSLELRLQLHKLSVLKAPKKRVRVDGYNSEILFLPMEVRLVLNVRCA